MKTLGKIFAFINQHPLARRKRLKAYWRFVSWQISQTVFPRERVVPFTRKTKLVVKKGLTGATGNIYTGLQEFSEMGFLLHFLRKDDLFADVGANVGSYTILAAAHVGAKTLSFEPIPSTFNWLLKNIAVNDAQSLVSAFNMGLGSSKNELLFTSGGDTVNHVVVSGERTEGSNVVVVAVDRFDSLAEKSGCPLLIKIDVEGFETEVIQGMSKTLAQPALKAIIIELNGSGKRYGYDDALIHQNLLDAGFSPFSYDPLQRRLDAINHYGNHNTIYIRDYDFCLDRVVSAPKVAVFACEF